MAEPETPGFSLQKLVSDRRGAALTIAAILVPVLLGAAGIAMDGAYWYQQKRQAQSIADSAAVAGAYAKLDGATDSEVEAVVVAEAERNGYAAAPGNSITITTPPAVPQGDKLPVLEIELRRMARLYVLSAIFEQAAIPVSAASMSGTRALGTQCVVALSETAPRAIEFTGNTTADIGCGVSSNSDNSEALYIGGSAILRANPAQAFGDIAIEGSGQLDSRFPPMPFSPRVDDPFSSLSPAGNPSCDLGPSGGGLSISDDSLLVDGDGDGMVTLCGDVTLSGQIAMDSGTYVIRNGSLRTTGNTEVTGTGVSILLTGDTPNDVGAIQLNNNTDMTLTAPDSGPMQGVLFFQDPMANSPPTTRLNGGVDLMLNGAIYMPRGHVEFSGGADVPNNCLQIFALTVAFTGNSVIRNSPSVCQALGIADGPSVQQQVVLME